MGSFSFMCKKSNEPVLSSSFSGDAVHLFLLKDGKVIEKMYGNYDSYGRVFKDTKDGDDISQTEYSSFKWGIGWDNVCNLMFDVDKSNGIAAILEPYWKEGDPYPTERSNNDQNQGWGKDFELFGTKSTNVGNKVFDPKHEIYN